MGCCFFGVWVVVVLLLFFCCFLTASRQYIYFTSGMAVKIPPVIYLPLPTPLVCAAIRLLCGNFISLFRCQLTRCYYMFVKHLRERCVGQLPAPSPAARSREPVQLSDLETKLPLILIKAIKGTQSNRWLKLSIMLWVCVWYHKYWLKFLYR